MNLHAELYNQALQRFAAHLAQWDEDLERYAQHIVNTQAQGKPTIGLETNYNNQALRKTYSMQVIEAADAYINALEAENQALRQRLLATGTQQSGGSTRLRICDLPPSPQQLQAELLETIENTIESTIVRLLTPRTA